MPGNPRPEKPRVPPKSLIARALRDARVPEKRIPDAVRSLQEILGGTSAPTSRRTQPTVGQVAALLPKKLEADQHFEKAYAAEDADVAAARAGYVASLRAHSQHLEARINLGRLLHLNGELKEAEKVYRRAKHKSALLAFNLAVLLEDLHREEEAAVSYREALALDPNLHHAHFNLSRLHERAQRPRDAFRHLLAYRRHLLRRDETP